MTAAQIAARLQRSESAVFQQIAAQRLGGDRIPRRSRPWTAAEDLALAEGVARGDSPASIAAGLGRTAGGVKSRRTALQARGTPLPPFARVRRWSVADDAMLADALRRREADARIAEQLGRTVSAVRARSELLRKRGDALASRRPRWTEHRRDALASKRRAGASIRELAEEFERDRRTIRRQIRLIRELGYDVGDR